MQSLLAFRTPASARRLLPAMLAAYVGLLHAAETPEKRVENFLNRYCLECHDAEVHKGDRAFHEFKLPLKTLSGVIEARDIIDQLTLREMPPKKADQPTDEERLAAIRALREGTAAAESALAACTWAALQAPSSPRAAAIALAARRREDRPSRFWASACLAASSRASTASWYCWRVAWTSL